MTRDKRDFFIVLIGKIAQVLLMLASLKISTYLLDPSVMGQIYLFTTIYTFFVFIFISPIGQYFNRYTHHWETEKVLYDRLWLYFAYMLIICVLASIGAVVIYLFGNSASLPWSDFILLTGSFVLIVSANQTVVPLLNMLGHRGLFTLLTFLTGLSALVFSIGFVYFSNKNATSWLLGILAGNILVLILAIYFLRKTLVIKRKVVKKDIYLSCINKANISAIAKFAVPVSFASVFMWAQNSGYRLSIESFLGLEYLGFLGIGLMVAGQISSVVEAILMQYLQPNFYRSIKDANFEQRTVAVNSYLNLTIPIYFSLALFLTFSIEFIFPVLVSANYVDGYIFCIFGVWLEFFRMTTNSISVIAHSEIKMKRYMYPYLFGALVTNLLIYITAQYATDTNTVPVVLIIGGLITMLLMYFNMKRIMPFILNKLHLLIFIIFALPSVLYFSKVTFPKEIGVNYIVLLGIGGCLFFAGLASSLFLSRKVND